MAEHEPIYQGAPVTVYETRCSCGEVFRDSTPHDVGQKFRRHRDGWHVGKRTPASR